MKIYFYGLVVPFTFLVIVPISSDALIIDHLFINLSLMFLRVIATKTLLLFLY